jgi:hypothetical protein
VVRVISVVAVLVVLLLLVPLQFGYNWVTACRGEERAVFEEFPQYDPRSPQKLDTKPDNLDALAAVGSGCVVVYSTPDEAREVRGYFVERLQENGWKVKHATEYDAPLYARRGNYEYRASFREEARKETRLVVIVRDL